MSKFAKYMHNRSIENALSLEDTKKRIAEYNDFLVSAEEPYTAGHYPEIKDPEEFKAYVKNREECEEKLNKEKFLSSDEKEFFLYCFLNDVPILDAIQLVDKYRH